MLCRCLKRLKSCDGMFNVFSSDNDNKMSFELNTIVAGDIQSGSDYPILRKRASRKTKAEMLVMLYKLLNILRSESVIHCRQDCQYALP